MPRRYIGGRDCCYHTVFIYKKIYTGFHIDICSTLRNNLCKLYKILNKKFE